MITEIDEKIYLKINKEKYCFSGEEYEELILFLTNPDIDLPDNIKIDDDIKGDTYKLELYKEFLNKFIESRNKIDREFEKEHQTENVENNFEKNYDTNKMQLW